MAAFVSVKENKWVRQRAERVISGGENVATAADNPKGRSHREEDKDMYTFFFKEDTLL